MPSPTPGKEAWFEDESFWTAFGPVIFEEKRWAEVPAVIDGIEALASPPKGARVMDACCGVGRHALELARRGYRVTGVDITGPYLAAAAESAASEGLPIEFLKADVRSFERPGAFDLCINLYSSFGYFASRDEDLAFARRVRASLTPGGAFFIETVGKETVARDFVESEWYERNGMMILGEYGIEGDWEGLRNRWIVMHDGQKHEKRFTQRLYSAVELRRLLNEAGFSAVKAYGSPTGAPYDAKAQALFVLAR